MATRETRVSLSSDEDDNEEEEEESNQHQQQPEIPHDLLTYQILIRLPIKTLIRFKSVSKCWYSIISSPQFGNAHFKLRPFSLSTQCLFVKAGQSFKLFCYDDDDDEIVGYFGSKGFIEIYTDFDLHDNDLHLVGSIDGLVCLSSLLGFFIVWNPITHQFRKISDPYVQSYRCSWGFGYTSFDNDYKIIRIVEMPKMMAHVFSLRANQWRRIDDKLYMHLFSSGTNMSAIPASLSFLTRRGVLVNETMYWIVDNTQVPGRKIIAFDLVLEAFDVFPYLNLISSGLYYDDHLLCVMGGCLSSCRVNLSDDVYITMFKSPEEQESVVLLSDFRLGACDDAVGFTRSGKFFIVDRYCRKLGLVDRSSCPFEYIPLAEFETHDVHIANHVPSLILPFTDEVFLKV